jgi:microcystin-dependent protein
MANLKMQITNAGRAALVTAEHMGTSPTKVTEIGVGTSNYTPSAGQTSLNSEVKRLTTFSGDVVAADTIHVTVRDESDDEYSMSEFGLYLEDGTLFAVYSQPDVILDKARATIMLLSVDVVLETLDAQSLTFGDTDFIMPSATTDRLGVIEIATQTEVIGGESAALAVTPATLSGRTATTTRTGLVELATSPETQNASGGDKVVQSSDMGFFRNAANMNAGILPAARLSGTYSINIGGNAATAADADKLGGQEGSYYRNAANMNAGTLPYQRLPAATETTEGGVKLATSAEVRNGTGDDVVRAGDMGWFLNADHMEAGTLPRARLSGGYDIDISGTASNASQLGGQAPAFYRDAANMNAGTLPSARLSGTYGINISGNAATAADADNLGGQAGSYYRNAGNMNAGTLPAARLSGTYGINVSGNADTASDADNLGGRGSDRYVHANANEGHVADFNSIDGNQVFSYHDDTLNCPDPDSNFDGLCLQMANGLQITQIASNGNSNLYLRGNDDAGGGESGWGPWHSVYTEGTNNMAGMVASFATSSAPVGWLKANGAYVSKTAYPQLYAAIGTQFGESGGDFRLPDLRGEFVRGWDDGRGVDSSRGFGSWQDSANKLHGHPFRTGDGNDQTDPSGGLAMDSSNTQRNHGEYTGALTNSAGEQIGGSGGDESRPRNVALLYCIKY